MQQGFTQIQYKLQQFAKKYYANELIKGTILFFSLGILYLLFTVFVEYFLWLKPTGRTILFWLFIVIEVALLVKYIFIPIFKLIGLRKGISMEESSKIIGAHFPEVEDKLLNILQLKNSNSQSDLILASINQKSKELQPIPFVKAIDFKENRRFLKYALIPIGVYLLSLITISDLSLTAHFKRVVNYKTAYEPPAPFSFVLENESLNVIQGDDLKINIKTEGSITPNEAMVVFNNQQYYLQKESEGYFSFTFTDIQQNLDFYITANDVYSKGYAINVINTPRISNISLDINYPNYLKKSNETLANAANIIIPEGSKINWKVTTISTDTVAFINKGNKAFFTKDESVFKYTRTITSPLFYSIATSNSNLKDFDKLQFTIDVIKDEYPLISVQSNIDSISRGPAQFAGQISDDYGLAKLQLVYYDVQNPESKRIAPLDLGSQNIQTFFYEFPNGLNLKEGVVYELFFQVFDNDAIHGKKSTKSKVFSYKQKTEEEIEQELLNEQRNTINSLENSIQKQKKQQEQLESIQQELQKKKNLNWNDKKKVDNLLKRQQQYQKMMQRQTDELEKNFDEKEEKNENLAEKKEDLKKRIQELKKLDKQQKLLDELQKMAEKLDKQDLVKKAKELAQQNRQQQRSLEKTLEMVKRFYVEQKSMQIANKLSELSKKQEDLEKQEETSEGEQNEIKEEFNEIKKELKELNKDNEKLKEPLELADVEQEKQETDKELEEANKNLNQKNKKQAKKNQKEAAKQMQKMSKKMQQSMMDMQSESLEENIDDLRKVLENLVLFSFQQEQLMNRFDEISTSHPDFGSQLKKQNEIKTYFEHIDDSLYVISMRNPKISNSIQNDLSQVHYNLEQSLENFAENRFNNGISNQRYVMTSSNNLADYLSSMLDNMMNNMSMKMGQGKPSQNGFSLPDLIQKQKGLSEQMKQGMQKSQQKGDGKDGKKSDEKGKPNKNGEKGKEGENGKKQGRGEGDSSNDLDTELYEIFKQQSQLRQALQNAISKNENGEGAGNSKAKKALKTMEQLENEILEKGFNRATLQKMQNLNYELLKLDDAQLEQGKDKKRKSNTNSKLYQRNKAKALQFKKQFYNQIEILNRQSLPLQQNYKDKVRAYFSDKVKD